MAPSSMSQSFLILLLSVPFTWAIDDFESFTKNVSSTLDALLLESNYDKRLRPDFGGPPTMVEVNMHIKSMGPVSENEQMYHMDVYFRQAWVDRRLKWEVPGLDEFSMSWLFLEKVWKPDTFFLNGKKSHLHQITSPNKFLRLRNDGSITYSMRLTIVATCKMHLRKFPLDSQKCFLIIGSYGYTTEDIIYLWSSSRGVTAEDGVELAQYDLYNITTTDNKFAQRGKDEYSIVLAEFHLKRTIGYFVLQIYVPCSLIVCCSWVSFWITPSDVAGRVSLAVTTVLSITTLGFGGRSQMPKVSHMTALDWWVIFCFTFVFAVILEYALINYKAKYTADLRKLIENRKKSLIEKKLEKRKSKEDATLQKTISDKGEASHSGLPVIKIEVTQHFEESTDPYLETKCLLKPVDAPLAKENSKEEEPPKKVELLSISSVSKMAQKRWRSVPNVLADEHLAGVKGDEWLKNLEELRRPKTPKERVILVLTAPVRYWKRIHFLPREEDLKDTEEEKRFTKIDIFARRLFPFCFSFFVLSYTLLYAYYIQDNIPQQ